MQKKVGIVGSGVVSQALAKGFLGIGCEVKVSSRTPEKLASLVKEIGGKLGACTFGEAAFYGDIVVLATLGQATENAITLAGPKNFAGKLVIDATNSLDFSKGMPPSILPAYSSTSLGESVQKKLPDAHVVKCFNTVPNSQMFRPRFSGARMLICGNDKNAKEETSEILKQFGWSGAIDIGGIEGAGMLESLVILWVRAAVATQDFNSMFVLVKG
jgi:8-hydroxy-5-deazaflavin:NADPH oxidoreductase